MYYIYHNHNQWTWDHSHKFHIMNYTWATFFEQSKVHKKRVSSSMLISLSCLPEGHQRTLFKGVYIQGK